MFGVIRTSGMTMKRGLRIVLIGQAMIAVLLMLTDVQARWRPWDILQEPLPTGPVAPGDQVRRYDPRRVSPGYTDPPVIDLPAEFPPRLEFELRQAEGFGELLLLNGPIEIGDARRLEAYMAGLATFPSAVVLNSPGGAVDEALEIGRMLRTRAADTLILPGMACASACPYILAAGTNRRVSKRGAVGMHQHYYDAPGYLPVFLAVEEIQHGHGQTMAYLIEMGIDPGVMIHSLNTPPDEIYVLVESELLDSGLATEVLE